MTDRSVRVLLAAEMRQFQRELQRTGAEAKRTARDAEGAFKAAGDGIDRAGDKAKRAGDKVAQSQERIRRLSEEMQRQERSRTYIGQGAMALEKYRSEWDQVSTSALRSGAVLTATSVLAAKAAMDWESAWAGVLKTADTDDPFKLSKLENDLRGLAKTLPESHKNIAAVAEAAGQLGVATDDVAAFTRIMVMLGDTTDLTAEEAATSIAQLMNVMQTAPDQVDNLGAALVALGNDGASTEGQIIQMAQRIAGAGEIVGLTEAQVLGVANALASSGIEVEAGGSAISAVLIKMENAVASGGEKLNVFAKTAGTSAADFAARWRSDPATALADFTEGLGRLDAEGGNVFGTLEQLGMTDIRVTRAMLNMANAGDLLRDSLDLGTKAFADNTALTEEAAKRYDTTAAQAEIAWNNIKDNAIDAGQGLLPVISAISDAVEMLSQAFGALPDPVKSSLGILAGGGGLALLAVGGFMKLAGSVSETYVAMSRLSKVAPGVASALTTMGKAAGIAAAALVALRIIGDLIDTDDVASVEDYTAAILKLGEGTQLLDATLSNSRSLTARGRGFSELASAIDEADPGKLNSAFGSLFGVIKMNPYGDAKEDIEQYDRALTSLVESGATEQAAKGYTEFVRSAEESGRTLEDVEKLLPGYTEAMKKLANEQEIATQKQDAFAESNKSLAIRLAELDPDVDKARKKLDEIMQSTRDAAMGFLDFTGGLDMSKASLQDWMAELEKMAKAQANWADNVVLAMTRGVDQGVIDKFKEMGPAGASMLEQLVNGSQAEIERLNGIFGHFSGTADLLAELDKLPENFWIEIKPRGDETAIEAAARVANAYDDITPQVETILRAMGFNEADIKAWKALLDDIDPEKVTTLRANDLASSVINSVKIALQSLDGNSASVNIRTNRVNTITTEHRNQVPQADGGMWDNGVRRYAAGGWDEYGRSVPRTPQLRNSGKGAVMWGEAETGWEAYISGKPGMESRNRDILALAAQRLGGVVTFAGLGFADGGFTEALNAREYTDLQIRIRDLRRSLRETEKYGKGGKRRRPALRGLDRYAARLELAEALDELDEQKQLRRQIGKGKKYRSAGAYNDAMKAREERTDTASSFTDGLDSDAFRSPASLERSLRNLVRDSAEYVQLLDQLRAAKASPWLIEQIKKVGPSRSTNRTMRALLADTSKLATINNLSSRYSAIGNAFADVALGGQLTSAQSSFLGGITKADLDYLAVQIGHSNAAAARTVAVREGDDRDYMKAGASRFPSLLAGVSP